MACLKQGCLDRAKRARKEMKVMGRGSCEDHWAETLGFLSPSPVVWTRNSGKQQCAPNPRARRNHNEHQGDGSEHQENLTAGDRDLQHGHMPQSQKGRLRQRITAQSDPSENCHPPEL